jgi:hypothetical protein
MDAKFKVYENVVIDKGFYKRKQGTVVKRLSSFTEDKYLVSIDGKEIWYRESNLSDPNEEENE